MPSFQDKTIFYRIVFKKFTKQKTMKAKLIGKGFIAKIARKDECVMLIGMNNKNEVSNKLNTAEPHSVYGP